MMLASFNKQQQFLIFEFNNLFFLKYDLFIIKTLPATLNFKCISAFSKMYGVVGSLQDLLLVALVQRVKGQMLYKRP